MTYHRLIRDDLKNFGDITELYEVKTFIGYRNSNRVTVSILDLGLECDSPDLRYVCIVEQKDGKNARGNPAPSVAEAISGVHWNDLD